ncbi:MAG: DegQ family serine endoprotease [Alphaproteobacteria bacterium]|nr:DegQ family serine endoprotease [Alphaproteobacteria bacterium]
MRMLQTLRLGAADTTFRWLLALPLAATLIWLPGTADARGAPESFADLVEILQPAVVNVSTTQKVAGHQSEGPNFDFPPGSPFRDFFDQFNRRGEEEDRPRRATSLGSGFIIDPSGLVVTNNHVIEGADKITVTMFNDTTLEAELIGRDTKTDLALLQIKEKGTYPAVPWGNSDKMRVGDWVIAIGNPLGLGGTVTAGIISQKQRDINAGPYDDYIQTDAPINRGNSGGPLFNMNGQVIGINTAIYSQSGGSIGIGFAIPSNLADGVIAQLREFGTTRRGWLGVQIQQVTDEIAESLGLKETSGALVAGVLEKSPAEAAKMKTGDVILKFNGRDVEESRKLPRIVAETEVGKTVDVVLWRDGRRRTVKVTLGELEKFDQANLSTTAPSEDEKPVERSIDELGLALSTITRTMAEKYSLDSELEGVLITDVKEDSGAAEKGLRKGDVIVEVNQEKVTTPDAVAARIKDAAKNGRRSVLLLINREGDLRFVALRIDAG